MLDALLFGLAAMVVVGTFLPLWQANVWWVRAWDFCRLQLLLLGLATAIAMLWAQPPSLGRHVAIALLVIASSHQVWRIAPYLRWARRQSRDAQPDEDGETLSVMVANVLMSNRQSEALLGLVRDRRPDVLFCVETDGWWADQLASLEDEFPHWVKEPLDNTYGLLLASRRPLLEPEVRHLLDSGVPSVRARVQLGEDEVELHCLHPKPPYPDESKTTATRDAEILIVGREIGEHDNPTVVAGDLNDVAWSRTTCLFQRVSGLLDPRIGRGMFSTFHARIPFMRWPLDHVFHSEHFAIDSLERLPAIGSDHFPILVCLRLSPRAATRQQAPDADAGDLDEARRRIAEGDAAADDV